MSDTVYVCSKCGAENSISRLAEVDAWEGMDIKDQDGKPTAIGTGDSEVDWTMVSWGDFHCSECEQQKYRLEEMVKPKVVVGEVECRDCGFLGIPTDHPADCGGELLGLNPPAPLPGQVALEIAA